MSRNSRDLKNAIEEIQARTEFYKEVKVPGDLNGFNEELAKAGRVADFLELGELFAKDAQTEKNLVEAISEKNTKHQKVRLKR